MSEQTNISQFQDSNSSIKIPEIDIKTQKITTPICNSIESILSAPEKFNAKKQLEVVTSRPKTERREGMKELRQNHYIQNKLIGNIPEGICNQLGSIDIHGYTVEQLKELLLTTVQSLSETLLELTQKQRKIIIQKLEHYIEKKKICTDYFYKYESLPADLLSDHKGMYIENTSQNIEMELVGANIIFYVPSTEIGSFFHKKLGDISSETLGTFSMYSKIQGLDNSIIIIKVEKKSSDTHSIKAHELQHAKNYFTLSDEIVNNEGYDFILQYGQDEIIAFLRDGSTKSEIKDWLVISYDYDYFATVISLDQYAKLRNSYISKIELGIDIACDLYDKGISLDLLAITPLNKWYQLKKDYKQEAIQEEVFESFEDGSYSGKKVFANITSQEGIFNKDGILISGYFTSTTKEENGKFKNGKLFEGQILYTDGTQKKGKFKNGELLHGILKKGDGSIINICYGYIKDDVDRNLEDRYYYFNDQRHIGTFENGVLKEGKKYCCKQDIDEGKDLKLISSGIYDGNHKLIYGYGTETIHGVTYEGKFHNGEFVFGIMSKINPDFFSCAGIFKDGTLIEGTKTFANGCIFIGIFTDGRLSEGRQISNRGDVFDGKFEDGFLIEGKMIFAYGAIHTGQFKDGKLIKGFITHKNGNVERIGSI